MNGQLIIEGDKTVYIKRIKQWVTYDGLLEGFPTARLNNSILSYTKQEAINFCGLDQVYLIEPEQTPISYDSKYAFGKPASLPPITCIAVLHHPFTFRDPSKLFSALGLIWFQQDYAFPIDAAILEQIKAVPFSEVCGEFEY